MGDAGVPGPPLSVWGRKWGHPTSQFSERVRQGPARHRTALCEHNAAQTTARFRHSRPGPDVNGDSGPLAHHNITFEGGQEGLGEEERAPLPFRCPREGVAARRSGGGWGEGSRLAGHRGPACPSVGVTPAHGRPGPSQSQMRQGRESPTANKPRRPLPSPLPQSPGRHFPRPAPAWQPDRRSKPPAAK